MKFIKRGFGEFNEFNKLNKSENATLQLSIFCEEVLDKKYLLKLKNVSQTPSKRLVENQPMCLVCCLSYASLSV